NEGNPATLTISYDPASPPTDKYPWLHKVVNGKWVRAPGSTADLTAGSVSAPITGFSTFAVVKIACHADITGTVTVAGVVPLKGIMISATRAGGGTSIGAVTRSDGSYHMILPVVLGLPATWTVTAQVLGYGLQVQATVTVAPCVTTTTVDLTVKLETVLEATPRLADFIVWETPYAPVAYRDWSSSEKDELEAYFVAALSGGASLSDPPTNLAAGSLPDGTFAETVLAPDAAWALYLANVGHSLAMEYSEQLAWSLTGYSDTALSILLDGRSFLKWVEHWSGVSGYQLFHPRETGGFVVRDVLPAPPSATYGFLTQHNIVSGDRVSTIARVFDWAREHMFHYRGNQLAENMEDHWQYRGSAPASRILSGTVRQSDGRFGSWTPGCHGTNWFLQDLLRAVNIPVQYRSGGGHATPFFIADGLALSHGDDLYTSFARIYSVGQPIPSEEFFIDEATWDAWFDPSVPYSDQQTNVGRRVSENAVAYLPDYLLYLRCEDINTGRSPGESGILESLGRHFQLAELEAANLWPRTDAKIATLGGCPSICPTWSTALSCHSSLEVATVTTGLGPSAYVVLVDGVEAAVTSVSGTATLYELWGRSYSVELSGLGSDCTVDGANPRSITLQPGETGHTTFDVSCGMPVIDGVLSPGEWDRAVEILVRDFGEYTGTTVYAMSDVSNVYFALRIPQPAPTSGDRFLVRFDNANNGVLELNEDQICAATPPSDWFDCHSYQSSEGMSWGAVDVQQDGSSAMTSDVAWKTFEVARPLSSGDPYDFSLVPGDIVGFCAAYFTGSSYVDYPAGCIYAGSDLSGYAELEVGGQ
ncbi:MAG: carboxypeptidase-like regulatory domain-containing protein, partial [Gemmatimonadota bacterium]|nr:carboxypeptidase-like regulatory domain-containing protein [Gemmatimonadota bacterium]